MKYFSLRRDNGRDIAFNGEALCVVDSRDYGQWGRGKNAKRWTEMALYRTEGKSFVVAISGRSDMPGEEMVIVELHSCRWTSLGDLSFVEV